MLKELEFETNEPSSHDIPSSPNMCVCIYIYYNVHSSGNSDKKHNKETIHELKSLVLR